MSSGEISDTGERKAIAEAAVVGAVAVMGHEAESSDRMEKIAERVSTAGIVEHERNCLKGPLEHLEGKITAMSLAFETRSLKIEAVVDSSMKQIKLLGTLLILGGALISYAIQGYMLTKYNLRPTHSTTTFVSSAYAETMSMPIDAGK
jgi:hypothetical protein